MSPHRFRPALFDALLAYDRSRFFTDVASGITVAAVALPLAMAFAIASGLDPQVGLYTAIVAGFLISLLGGCRVQIGGPAGAFIVVVYSIVQQYGVLNLLLATAISGVILMAMGWFRLGTLIRFIPVAVVIGFTNGIAVLIALSQVKELLGLQVPMPADFFGILHTVQTHANEWNPHATGMVLVFLIFLLLWQYRMPRWQVWLRQHRPALLWLTRIPGSIWVLVLATGWTVLTHWPVETLGSRFGGIPNGLPSLHWPDWELGELNQLWVPVMTLSLLGAIESLLCARVADNLTGWRHNPNQELMAQGLANLISPFFGGMPATGTVARTVTNIKNGATSPVAGMTHALVLLLVLWVAAPLANAIPLAALSAILLQVAWNMGDWQKFLELGQFRLPYRLTLLAVFVLTIVVDLTVAVQVGLVAACLTFIYRISSLSRLQTLQRDDRIAVHALHGALFFAAVQLIEDLSQQLPTQAMVLDLRHVIYLDSSGMDALVHLSNDCQSAQVRLLLVGLQGQPRDMLQRTGMIQGLQADLSHPDVASALAVL